MRNKSFNNKNEKKHDPLSQQNKSEAQSRLYSNNQKQQPIKLTKEDYLYSFPTCGEGSNEEIYLDEIVVYYSFN
jgi:hypothetical protein